MPQVMDGARTSTFGMESTMIRKPDEVVYLGKSLSFFFIFLVDGIQVLRRPYILAFQPDSIELLAQRIHGL